MKLIIGIPVKNDLSSLQLMINSLVNSTKAIDKILIVESDSTDGSKEYCDFIAKIDDRVEVIHANVKTPLEAYNMLFDKAIERESDLLITQTDVIFPKLLKRDWLKEMRNASEMDDSIGAITCLNGGHYSGPTYVDNFYWLGGWCSYYPLRTLKKVGGYDTDFPNGYGVDIDHTYRIAKEGLKVISIEYFVDHHMSNERLHDKDENTEQAKEDAAIYFRKKHKLGEFKNVVD